MVITTVATNGFKGCPTCTPREKIKCEEEGTQYTVKKGYFSPEDKLNEKEELYKKKLAKHLKENPDANIDDIKMEDSYDSE